MSAGLLVAALTLGASQLYDGARGGEYAPSTGSELLRARDLFRESLSSAEPSHLESSWREIGFRLHEVSESEGIWAIEELPQRQTGAGFYLFRAASESTVAVTAPHGLESDDRLTAEIASRLFRAQGFKAAAWSTVPRSQIDLAHSRETIFHQFTLAFAEAQPRSLVIQVHGFRKDRRTSEAGRRADAILSNGTRRPPRDLRRMTKCLGQKLGIVAGWFPEISELGALTNHQGQDLHELGTGDFLHLELALGVRTQLSSSMDDVGLVGECLLEYSE